MDLGRSCALKIQALTFNLPRQLLGPRTHSIAVNPKHILCILMMLDTSFSAGQIIDHDLTNDDV
jgi:hypothetical protein